MRPFKSRIQGTALTALQVPELPQGVAIEAARCPRTPSSCRPKGNKQPLRLPQILMPAHSHAGLLQIPINRSGVGLGICIFNSPPHHHQKASWALWRNNSRSQPGRQMTLDIFLCATKQGNTQKVIETCQKEPTFRDSHWPNLGQCKHENK